MTIDYIRVPAHILGIKNISPTQKLILGLVVSLDDGLKLSNHQLGELLTVTPNQISTTIGDLEKKGHVMIRNKQSKYRVIYFRENHELKGSLLKEEPGSRSDPLPDKPESRSGLLPGLTEATFGKTRNITKGTNIKNNMAFLFDRFWKAYPRKVKKPQALKAWQKLNPNQGLFDQIMKTLEAHKKSNQWTGQSGKYIPHPITWLNNESWNDTLDSAESQAGNPFGTHPATEEDLKRLEEADAA
jgi:hypothetical protein